MGSCDSFSYTLLFPKCLCPFSMYLELSSMTIKLPLSACFMTMVLSFPKFSKVLISFDDRLRWHLTGVRVSLCSLSDGVCLGGNPEGLWFVWMSVFCS